MNKLLALALFSLLFYCCKNSNDNYPYKLFNIEKKLDGKILSVNSFLGNPTQIVSVDSLLMIQDFDGKYLVSFINPSTGDKVGSICQPGKGPGEFLRPIEVSYNKTDNTIDILERSLQKLSHLKIDWNNVNTPQLVRKVSFSQNGKNTMRVKKANDSLYIGTGTYENRYALFNKSGNLIKTQYDYPDLLDKDVDLMAKSLLYQSFIEVNPHNNKMVATTLFSDNIEFFDVTQTNISRLKVYGNQIINFINKSSSNRIVFKPTDNNRMGYICMDSDDNYVFCLYSGRSVNECGSKSKAQMGNHILVYNWKGEPIMIFNLDRDIKYFTINPGKKTIYAIVHSPDPQIVEFEYQL